MDSREKREYRRKAVAFWKSYAQALRNGTGMLQREARHEALRMIEDSARTPEDFEKLIILWDVVDAIRGWRVGKNEKLSTNNLHEYKLSERENIIPPMDTHAYWRQLLYGNFIDVIFDCPHDIQENMVNNFLYRFIKKLDESHKEILYYWTIRCWTPQKIAAIRGQTDRNIRKVYNKMISDMRLGLFWSLYPRYISNEPLTSLQLAFMKWYQDKAFKNNED